MATHSGILAWRISWTKEPGGLQSTGWQTVELDMTERLTHTVKITTELETQRGLSEASCLASWFTLVTIIK